MTLCDGCETAAFTRRTFLAAGAMAVSGCCAKSGGVPGQWYSWGQQGRRHGDFVRPRAVGVDGGEVFVIDMNGRVQVFTEDGEYLRAWDVPHSEKGTPTAITFADDGRVIIPDTHYSRILEYDRAGNLLTEWGAYGTGETEFIYPTGVALDEAGHFFFSEYGIDAEQVRVFDPDRNPVRNWGEFGENPGQFNRAMALTLGRYGAVYVADTANHRIQCFDPEGNLRRVIGSAGTTPGQLKFPHDVATAPDWTLLVSEYGSHRISRFHPDGAFLGAVGAPGRSDGEFNAPRGVAVSETGRVFVADTDNHRVVRFPLEAVET